MIVLHSAGRTDLSLTEALASVDLVGATALLAAPARYNVAVITEDGCAIPAGPVDLSPVFEARAFTADAELRWLHEADGRGHAVLLTEDTALLPASFERLEELTAFETLPAHYLIWGRSASVNGTWTTLTAGRIGALDVPVHARGRARLTAVEYVAAEPAHGNAYVAEERLTGLEPYKEERPAE